MVTYLAGNRAVGTNAERLAFAVAVAGWKELARTTLGSVADQIDVTGLSNKRYYMILSSCLNSGSIAEVFRTGNGSFDIGTNYSHRYSGNGGADSTTTSATHLLESYGVQGSFPTFGVGYIANYSTKEKLGIMHRVGQNTAGAGNAPNRNESVGKWVNTSNTIDRFRTHNADSGDFDINSELVVLGWDPADAHTTNFWTELGTATANAGDTSLQISFTAKKYLWIQGYVSANTATNVSAQFNIGNGTVDTGASYSYRYSYNGGADATGTSNNDFYTYNNYFKGHFFNIFIVNSATKEKLILAHGTEYTTTGAGTAPNRIEYAQKWANTSNQANIIKMRTTQGSYSANTTFRVWGSD